MHDLTAEIGRRVNARWKKMHRNKWALMRKKNSMEGYVHYYYCRISARISACLSLRSPMKVWAARSGLYLKSTGYTSLTTRLH